MVSRPGGNTHERKIVLNGDGGDEGLGPVPSGHAQAVGPTGDGVPCQLLEIEAVVEHDHLDPEILGQTDQVEFGDLAPTRPWVADQDGVVREVDRRRSTSIM